jgi:hypothetical protein
MYASRARSTQSKFSMLQNQKTRHAGARWVTDILLALVGDVLLGLALVELLIFELEIDVQFPVEFDRWMLIRRGLIRGVEVEVFALLVKVYFPPRRQVGLVRFLGDPEVLGFTCSRETASYWVAQDVYSTPQVVLKSEHGRTDQHGVVVVLCTSWVRKKKWAVCRLIRFLKTLPGAIPMSVASKRMSSASSSPITSLAVSSSSSIGIF